MQDAVAAGSVLGVEEDARLGGARDHEHVVSISSWLLRYLSAGEQRALSRLWMFRGGFGLEAANAMLGTEAPVPVPRLLRDLEHASCLQAARSLAKRGGSARYSVHALVGDIFQEHFSRLSDAEQHGILQGFGKVMIGHADQLTLLVSGGRWLDASALLADEMLNFQGLRLLLDAPGLASWAKDEDRLSSLSNLGCCEIQLGYSTCAAQFTRECWS